MNCKTILATKTILFPGTVLRITLCICFIGACSLAHAHEFSRLGYEIDSTAGDRQTVPDRRWDLLFGQNGTIRNGDDLESSVLMNNEESSVTRERHTVHFISELSAGNRGLPAL